MTIRSQPDDRVVVLVVDDEPLVRMLTADILSEAGFEVIEAGNAEQGLQRLSDNGTQVAAIVTDIEMPGHLNGYALAWRARSMLPDAAVLVVSGQVWPAPEELPPKSRFVSKPVDPQQLVRELREALAAN
jgi:CheY-like chemotaxis protein